MTVTTASPLVEALAADTTRSSDGRVTEEEPAWITDLEAEWGERVVVPEWEHYQDDEGNHGTVINSDYRAKNGWKGTDLVHAPNAPVRVTNYFVRYDKDNSRRRGGVGTTLTGIVQFTERAESHKGLCHGGSMCSVVDDCVGWTAFLVTGQCRPWSGYTVQLNTSLQRPVLIHSTLLVRGVVTKVQGRKVSVTCEILDPLIDNAVHATCQGLVILDKTVAAELDSLESSSEEQRK